MHGIVQEPLLRGAFLRDVDERADDTHDLAVGADDRPRAHAEPGVVAVGAAQAKFLIDAAAALLEHGIERGTVGIAFERMDQFKPGRGGPFKLAALQSKLRLDFGTDEDAVAGYIPVEDHVISAGERQRLALDIGDRPMREAPACKCVLHDREADQHDDQHETADQSRRDEIVRERSRHRKSGRADPRKQQKPSRN